MRTETALDHARVLLVDADRRRSRGIARVLRSAATVELVEGLDVPDPSWDVVVVVGLDSAEQCKPGVISQQNVVFLGEALDRAQLAHILEHYRPSHVLASMPDQPEELLTTVQKILRRDIFGLDKYFSWGSEFVDVELRRSSQRDEVMEIARAFGQRVGVQSRMIEQFCGAVDELVTNALYNAPVDGAGARRFAHLSRTEPVELAPHEAARVAFGTDGLRLGVSVRDPFGTLEPDTALRYIAKGLRAGSDQIDDKAGGAGLGLFQVFESLSHLVMNLSPRDATEIIGLMDIRGRFKDFVSKPKSLDLFVSHD